MRTGEVVDILLDVTNPGRWMAHCHIAEHHESGMMFSFDVAPAELMTDRYDAIVVGGGQAGLAIGYFLAQQQRALRDPGGRRHAGGGVARALGLAAAVYSGALRQPARAARSPATRTPTRPATTSRPT